MLPTEPSSPAKKKIVALFGALLAINIAVAHIVTAQISSVSQGYEVKDEEVVTPEEPELFVEEEHQEDAHDDLPSISIYTVQAGDTISGIASKFGVSQNTILWANEMTSKSLIKPGQALVILPINGIQYTVQAGDTISGIASKFDADAEEILYFNDLDDPKKIQPGLDLIIPDAEPIPKSAPVTPKKVSTSPVVKQSVDTSVETKKSTPSSANSSSKGRYGIFIVPVPGSVLTQGYHPVNAVDFGAPIGTPVLAAAEGTVIVAKSGCSTGGPKNNCNGGFGNFVVISHSDGIQTLYAHLSVLSVSVGDSIDQGEKVGAIGNTGRSTGPHLHFETHGISNPFTKDSKYTKY
ncbi:M23 family metallopeptidase [Candidatus Nomurabacteria bacterium]|nr:M23 family metallopeptidase [Candidatus Nomurabacteria bacterium]